MEINSPEKRLMLAMLNRAFLDLLSRPKTKRETEIKTNAEEWFLSKSDTEFTFLYVCCELGLSLNKMLKEVSTIQEVQRAGGKIKIKAIGQQIRGYTHKKGRSK